MTYSNSVSQQSAFRAFARIDHWAAPHAVTLTMKQGLNNGSFVLLTNEAASRNYRHFLNVLNDRVFGKAAQRFGRRVNSISTIEGGGGKRIHIHGVIDCPLPDLVPRFPALIAEVWRKSDWGHQEIHIQPGADAGWTKYISKLRDKPNYADSIDWENYHNADCRV